MSQRGNMTVSELMLKREARLHSRCAQLETERDELREALVDVLKDTECASDGDDAFYRSPYGPCECNVCSARTLLESIR